MWLATTTPAKLLVGYFRLEGALESANGGLAGVTGRTATDGARREGLGVTV